jgi:hypothetical protein
MSQISWAKLKDGDFPMALQDRLDAFKALRNSKAA